MPTYFYRGRDRTGALRSGERPGLSAEDLGNSLVAEGITPLEIKEIKEQKSILESFQFLKKEQHAQLEDLAIFARQMQLLHEAGVPIITSLKQIASFTRMKRLSSALEGCVEYIEKGEKLSSAMAHFPNIFSKLIVNVVQIGENTGKLSESFGHLHEYLNFESKNIKQMKAAFRYPMFVSIAILLAIVTLNLFVIPTFARFYSNMEIELPWQTRLLIGSSHLMTHYGLIILAVIIIGTTVFYKAIRTPKGAIRWGKFVLNVPLFGKLVRRITLIRLSQSLAIILNAGLGITQALTLVRDLISNAYVKGEIESCQKLIERGTISTKAISKIELFSPLELQIISVGEQNGELGKSMDYIGDFHANEIEFDLKTLNDWIGPILVSFISIMILIVAMGIYLPIWNMINLAHT